jgi:hypothetical protein
MKGAVNCFATNANSSGDNPDLTTQVFVAERAKVTNVTRDTRRCLGGRSAGKACTRDTDCPDAAACTDPSAVACAADAHGKVFYFIYSGNPTGENPDLSPELFSYRLKGHQLAQVTKQGWFCSADPSKPCTKDADCSWDGHAGTCTSPAMGDLQVSSNGREVMFVSSGDPGDNPQHGQAVHVLTVHGKKTAFSLLGGGGGAVYCSSDTANAYKPCTVDADCGAVCGDGKKEAPEQCESAQDCAPNQACVSCKCQPTVCGNGFREGNEVCDGLDGCPLGTCSPDCKTCNTCGNGAIDSGEECDPAATPQNGCPQGHACDPKSCTCS